MSGMARGQTVSLQAALSDSTFLNLRLTCKGDGERTLTLTAAYLTRHGNLKRTPVACSNLSYRFDQQEPASFYFSLNFSYNQRPYRAHGSYTAAPTPDDMPDCSLRCVPLRLSDKTLRESEYPNYP
jgi:hypothetical protein